MKREQLSSLTYQHVENTLMGLTWKYKYPSSVHEAINDILTLNANEVVAFLSNQAIVMGSQMELNEIKSILGGE
ncbi:MAG: post-transcriptional regulator [Erysipelotrichaceae bacterium]|nr:post-transcriptional regulator [Erysipelotrichaceae bacterium]